MLDSELVIDFQNRKVLYSTRGRYSSSRHLIGPFFPTRCLSLERRHIIGHKNWFHTISANQEPAPKSSKAGTAPWFIRE